MRRERPSPLDEARSGMAVFEQTLWDAVPRYLRTLNAALVKHTGRGLPLDARRSASARGSAATATATRPSPRR